MPRCDNNFFVFVASLTAFGHGFTQVHLQCYKCYPQLSRAILKMFEKFKKAFNIQMFFMNWARFEDMCKYYKINVMIIYFWLDQHSSTFCLINLRRIEQSKLISIGNEDYRCWYCQAFLKLIEQNFIILFRRLPDINSSSKVQSF